MNKKRQKLFNVHIVTPSHPAFEKAEKHLVDYHTHGLEKLGLKNVCMFYDCGNDDLKVSSYGTTRNTVSRKSVELFYDVIDMMIDGEKFEPYHVHFLDDPIDGTYKRFWLIENEDSDSNEIRLRIMPLSDDVNEYIPYEITEIEKVITIYESWIDGVGTIPEGLTKQDIVERIEELTNRTPDALLEYISFLKFIEMGNAI